MTTPCLKQLDAECFRARPAWAKQAFAYRLVHLLTPKPLTKRLPKGLRTALLAPGVMLPPGVEMPAGIVVAPGAEIPAGWTAGDPLPPGAIAAPSTPPGVEESGATPPTYVAPGEPGPINQPGRSPAPGVDYWFSDYFKNLTAGSWTDVSEAGGSATIESGQLKLVANGPIGDAGIRRTEARAWPLNWTWTFSFKYESGTGIMRHEIYTGTYLISIAFIPTSTIQLSYKWGTLNIGVANFMNLDHVWKLVVVGQTGSVYRDADLIISAHDFLPDAGFDGRTTLYHDEDGTSYTDYMIINDDTV